jgi:hypothetical protein
MPTPTQAHQGDPFDFGDLKVPWKIDAQQTGGRFSVVRHPIAPKTLAAPFHYPAACDRPPWTGSA